MITPNQSRQLFLLKKLAENKNFKMTLSQLDSLLGAGANAGIESYSCSKDGEDYRLLHVLDTEVVLNLIELIELQK